jgi:hypothetical protein
MRRVRTQAEVILTFGYQADATGGVWGFREWLENPRLIGRFREWLEDPRLIGRFTRSPGQSPALTMGSPGPPNDGVTRAP